MEKCRIFNALSNEYRIRILDFLKRGDARPHEIEKELGLTRSGLERHLKVLLEEGFIKKKAFLVRGKVRLNYCLEKNVDRFLEALEEVMEIFLEVEEERRKEDRVEALKIEMKSLEDTLKNIEKMHEGGEMGDEEFERLRRDYSSKLSKIVNELLDLI
ncbi:MAG: ArsR/SmtB family transcription factor [Candidatus Methanofastidiosia archaeon]